MYLTPELEQANLSNVTEMCLPINLDLGPVHVHDQFCIGVTSQNGQLVIYATHNGADIFRQPLANLCQDFAIGPAALAICISDIQVDNGMPKFHVKLEACISFLGRHCVTILDQVVGLGRVLPAHLAAFTQSKEPGFTIEAVSPQDAFFYTFPAPQTWATSVSVAGTQISR